MISSFIFYLSITNTHVHTGQDPTCGSVQEVQDADVDLLINISSTNPCIRCIDINGQPRSSTLYTLSGEDTVSRATQRRDLEVFVTPGGELLFENPGRFIMDGRMEFTVRCLDSNFPPFLYDSIDLFSSSK